MSNSSKRKFTQKLLVLPKAATLTPKNVSLGPSATSEAAATPKRVRPPSPGPSSSKTAANLKRVRTPSPGPSSSKTAATPKRAHLPSPEPQSPPAPTEPALKFAQYNGNADWVGFKRSITHKSGRHYSAQCQFCFDVIPGRKSNLLQHKANCVEIPPEDRLQLIPDNQPQIPVSRNQSIIALFAQTERSQENSDYLMAMAIITGDIPYRFLQNPFLLAYQQKYEIKGRQRLSDYRLRNKILPALLEDAQAKVNESLSLHNDWTLSMDGWKDVSGNSIVAVMMIDPESQHYLGNLELDYLIHSAANLKVTLNNLLGNKINMCKAIVTDNPRVNVRFREDFCSEHEHITNLKCVLHVINIIMKHFVNHKLMSP